MPTLKEKGRIKRKARIRKKINGTATIPRLSVYRSIRHTYAQVIDDENSQTLVSVCTEGKKNAEAFNGMKKVSAAEKVGEMIAKRCAEKGIEGVVFDRNGFQYHGRVKALADAARKAGLRF